MGNCLPWWGESDFPNVLSEDWRVHSGANIGIKKNAYKHRVPNFCVADESPVGDADGEFGAVEEAHVVHVSPGSAGDIILTTTNTYTGRER